ncbi:hypothetical protein ACQ5SO_08250 [Rhodovulum sp. DZ06]|uniref:hypothetical protein n=1 Tax=Rhodovulum sp. DZ06 TaxID=3425126 RepID=UPI003D33A154
MTFQDAQSGRNEPDLDPDDAIPTRGSTVRQQMTTDFAAVQAGFNGVDTYSASNEALTAVDL